MSIIDEFKSIVEVVRQLDNVELLRKVVELQGEAVQLVAENNELKAQVNVLKEKTRIRESLKFKHDVYWVESPEGHDDGPYCSNCWDVKEKLVRMVSGTNPQTYFCPNCNLGRKISR